MNVLIDRLLKYSGFRWDPSSFAPMVGLIQSRPAIEQLQMADAARAMELYDFEKTVYWGIISGAIVSRDKRCRNCAYPARLTVHHVTYVNLGRE